MTRTPLGSWLTRGDLAIAEVFSRHEAFGWLAIDMEHSAVTIAEAENLIRVIQSHGKKAFIRLPSNDPHLIGKVLDLGANGIIVPMVNSAADAARAVAACFYPPKGRRGVGLSRGQGYTPEGFAAYRREAHDGIRVVVQIEDRAALPNVDEIFAVDGLYGFFIGPYDLSASLGRPGELACEEMREATNCILAAGKRAGLVAGLHVVEPDADEVLRRINEGFEFIAVSFDMLFLIRALDTAVSRLNI